MRPWLPLGDEADGASALARILAAWFQKWFTTVPRITWVLSTEPARSDLAPSRHVAAHAADPIHATIGASCLGLPTKEEHFPKDQEVLRKLGKAIVDDLAAWLETSIPPLSGVPDHVRAWTVKAAGDPWQITICLSEEALCRIRQRAAGSARDVKLGTLSDALSQVPVVVGCHLGRASLTAAELRTLAAGDVVMFDRTRNEAVPLVLNGVTAPASGSARIRGGPAGATVTLATSPKISGLK